MTYELLSVTRSELNICESFYPTHKAAYDAMIEDIILSTAYDTEEEIIEASKNGECELTETGAWAETNQNGTGQWNIVKLPAPELAEEKVFIYKQYRDDYAYGEELITVFAVKDAAMQQLRIDIEKHYDMAWDDIPAGLPLDENDVFLPDYVSVQIGFGDATCYWIIEEQPVMTLRK